MHFKEKLRKERKKYTRQTQGNLAPRCLSVAHKYFRFELSSRVLFLKVCKLTARVPMSGHIIEKEKEEMFTRTLLCRGEKQEMFWERLKKESCFCRQLSFPESVTFELICNGPQRKRTQMRRLRANASKA